MKLDNKWLRWGLAVTCGLVILLLLPVLFSTGRPTTQRYVIMDNDDSELDQRDDDVGVNFGEPAVKDSGDAAVSLSTREAAAVSEPLNADSQSNAMPAADDPEGAKVVRELMQSASSEAINLSKEVEGTAKVEKATDLGTKPSVVGAVEASANLTKSGDELGSERVVKQSDVQQDAKTVSSAKQSVIASDSGCWRVQMGSFAQPQNAKILKSKLERRGYSVVTRTSSNGRLTRVLAGVADSRQQALQLKRQLKEQVGIDGVVVRD